MTMKDQMIQEPCNCAEKGLKIHSWDTAFEWIESTDRSMMQTGRRIHTPCGRFIGAGAVRIDSEATP